MWTSARFGTGRASHASSRSCAAGSGRTPQYPLVTACLAAADDRLAGSGAGHVGRALPPRSRGAGGLPGADGPAGRPGGREGPAAVPQRRNAGGAVVLHGDGCGCVRAGLCAGGQLRPCSGSAAARAGAGPAARADVPCLLHAAAGRCARAPAVPGAGAAFVASSPDFPYAGERCCTLELDGTLPPAARHAALCAGHGGNALLRKAAEHVREAKRIHDELEALCRPYVDFAAADALAERTLHELFPA